MFNWYLKVLQQYFDFSGRARRKEFWYFTLCNVIIALLLTLIDNALGLTVYEVQSADQTAITLYYSKVGALASLYYLILIIPSFAVSVRRLHDTGRTGWWLLLYLLPFVGAIILFIFYILDSEPGTNQYGPNPKSK